MSSAPQPKTSNKPLKAFVRYDNQGRVIAGSLITRSKMPKDGNWKEILVPSCCNQTRELQ